jgi:putative photosynthetic complex assembly protein 2
MHCPRKFAWCLPGNRLYLTTSQHQLTVDNAAFIIPILYVLFVWWISTGVILYLDQLAPSTFFISLSSATAVGIGALMMLALASHEATVTNAYIAFTAAILIWGWQEMAFLMGAMTGPRRALCPPNATEAQRFLYATEAILYHELALVISTAVLFMATWQQPNQVGTYTFFTLWVMRLSAKLNLFFGVRNRYESFLPPHLAYMSSYFGKRSINWLFPVVVTAASIVAYRLWQQALAVDASQFERASFMLLATLLTLAILEHWFLIVPLPVEKMWRWAMRSTNADCVPAPKDQAAKS